MLPQKVSTAPKKIFKIMAVLALSVFLYLFVGRFNYIMSRLFIRTTVAKQGIIEVFARGEGLMIRNEHTVTSPLDGLVLFLVEDKQQVRSGQIIAEVSEDRTGQIQQKRDEINRQIEILDTQAEQRAVELTKKIQYLTEDINDLKKDLNTALSSGQGDLAARVSDQLQQAQNELDIVEQEYAFLRQTTEKIRQEFISDLEKVALELKGESVLIKAPSPGMVSLGYDGWENAFKVGEVPDELWKINDLKDRFGLLADNSPIQAGQAVFRLIDNFEVYVFVVLDDFIQLNKNQWVWIRWGDMPPVGEKAKVVSVHNSLEGMGVWLALDVFKNEFADLRRLEGLKLVTESHKGVMIPKTAIDRSRGKSGVFLMADGKPVFHYVNVIAEDDKNAIVDKVPVGSIVVTNPQRIAQP
jgi:putative membrane fusion protein